MVIREWLALVAFTSACVFGTAGLIGLVRFSDPYSRMQSGGLLGTTAVFSTFIGALLLAPDRSIAARIVIIMIFFLISAPTGSYIVARFTWQAESPSPRARTTRKRFPREDIT